MALSTTAVPAFGAQFQMCSDANGTNPTTIAEVKDFDDGTSAQTEDSTTHSTGNRWRTHIVTLFQSGPFSMALNYVGDDPTHNSHTGLLAVFRAGEERTYRIVPSDGSEITEFNALINGLKRTYPVAGIRGANVTFQGTGMPDFDA